MLVAINRIEVRMFESRPLVSALGKFVPTVWRRRRTDQEKSHGVPKRPE
jgi:hypothetical protein